MPSSQICSSSSTPIAPSRSSLVFEFPQSAVRAMGPLENESLAALAELGFRFSMDNVTDLRMDPRDLGERGFRFIKVSAMLLLNRVWRRSTDIHPADFSDLLGRFGIDLIAERIESEAHRGRPARLRRTLRPGLPVLAAPPGTRRSAAGGGGRGHESPPRSAAVVSPSP